MYNVNNKGNISKEEAIEKIKEGSWTKFDPRELNPLLE